MKLPESPTTALPGSEEKIQVMASRFAAEEYLFHPDDALKEGKTAKKKDRKKRVSKKVEIEV